MAWLATIIWTIKIFDQKGRKKLYGFVLGLLFGPFAVIIAYLIPQLSENSISEKKLYDKLLMLTRGDESLAERLINLEKEKNPNLNRKQLIKNAIERLEYDRW